MIPNNQLQSLLDKKHEEMILAKARVYDLENEMEEYPTEYELKADVVTLEEKIVKANMEIYKLQTKLGVALKFIRNELDDTMIRVYETKYKGKEDKGNENKD